MIYNEIVNDHAMYLVPTVLGKYKSEHQITYFEIPFLYFPANL